MTRESLRKKSLIELLKMQKELQDNPQNKQLRGESIYIFKPSVRKKMDAIAWAIYSKTKK